MMYSLDDFFGDSYLFDDPSDYPFLSARKAALYMGVSAGHLRDMRSRGEGPPYSRLSASPGAAVVYSIEDIDAWYAFQLVEGGGFR